MPATLHTLKATIEPGGVVRLLQSLDLDAPAEAVVTVLVPSREPNATTVAAMHEPAGELPRFGNTKELMAELDDD
jgi:hypothetical protein